MTNTIKYKGHQYTLVVYAENGILTYEQIRPQGAMEIGDAFDPDGKRHPGWADINGKKFAEVPTRRELRTQTFIRIDNLDGWRWEWDEGASQETVNDTYKMETDRRDTSKMASKYIRVRGSLYVLAN